MRNGIKGSYTVEAAIILPIFILAIITLGSFIKIEGIWENVFNCAADEIHYSSMRGYDRIAAIGAKGRVEKRIIEDNKELAALKVSMIPAPGEVSGVTLYRIKATVSTSLPMGFGHDFSMDAGIKSRDFSGKRNEGNGIGREGLETDGEFKPVIVFPQMGEKFHGAECTYVKAAVEKKILSGELRQKYSACGLCKSGELQNGSVVYCFKNDGTAYHKSSCRSVDRHTITIDREEAISKGYTPCSKCNGY